MHHIIKSKIDAGLTFGAMCNARNTRKQVAQKFYTLLVLKKAHTIEMIQDGSYEEIRIEKGPKFGMDTVGL
jgi:cohesin complex subunit SCC1